MDMHDEQRYQNLYLSERLNTNNMISNNAQLYEDPTIISISAWKQTGYERKIRTPYKDLHQTSLIKKRSRIRRSMEGENDKKEDRPTELNI
jgi:hypothetical protein